MVEMFIKSDGFLSTFENLDKKGEINPSVEQQKIAWGQEKGEGKELGRGGWE